MSSERVRVWWQINRDGCTTEISCVAAWWVSIDSHDRKSFLLRWRFLHELKGKQEKVYMVLLHELNVGWFEGFSHMILATGLRVQFHFPLWCQEGDFYRHHTHPHTNMLTPHLILFLQQTAQPNMKHATVLYHRKLLWFSWKKIHRHVRKRNEVGQDFFVSFIPVEKVWQAPFGVTEQDS